MKAIIEIPNDVIRRAGSAIAVSHPKTIDAVIAAVQRLGGTEELVLRFDSDKDREAMEANTAILAVTQVMEDIAKEYGQD